MSVPVQSTVTVSSFLGLDRRARGELGSFREMENLTSDGYPTLTVRPRRGLAGQAESPGGIAAKDALIWVDGHTLYVGGVATELVLTEGSKQLIGMGNWLIVWPDKKYINTGDLSRYGSLENRVQTQGQVTLSLCGAKGAALGDYLASEEPPTDPAEGCLWLDTAGELPVLRQYGESGWSIREDTYIKIAAGGIGVGFAAGDGVVIEGCREESLNGSHVLEAAEDGALVVPGMIAGQATQTEELTVRRSVPEMDFVIESGNRLWGCRYANTTGSYNLEKDSAYYVLQGQKVYQTYQYTAPGWYLLGERTVTVRHGADGNGSVQLGGQWVSDVESSWTPASLSVSAAVALPRILRPSVLRAAELTLGQVCVLTIRAEEERYTHRVTYALGGASGTVVQETAQRELTWTPPLELARQLPRSVAGTMRLTVTTYDGGTTMGRSVTECRVYVPDTVRPTAALTVTPVNDNAVLEQWGVFVKGMTRLRWQVTAQGAYGSSIDGCSVSCGGVGGSGLNGVSAGAVSVSGEVTAAAVVKDSRGRSVSVEAGSVTVYEYSGPTMTRPAVCRCDADGTACSDGGYVKVKCGTQCSDVGGRNQVSLRVRSRRPGGEFGGYTALESGVEKVLPGFSPLLSYELELSAEDLPGSRRTVVCAIPTAAAAVHLASGGTAVGVGKYAEHDRAVEVNPEWEVYVKGKPLWELIYPVGSLYLSAVDTDPGVLFGGTWERIRDRFLLAAGTAYGAGTTGGEAVHTLAENELPIHAHDPANQAGYYGFITNSQKAFTVGDMGVQSGSGRYYPYAPAAFDISRNTKTGSVGGGKAHNNMPPYLAVYVWQRTA